MKDGHSKRGRNARVSEASTMALEDNLLDGRDAAGLGLRAADCFFHRTCSPRVARTRDGGYGFRSPAVCLELDRYAEPPPIRRANPRQERTGGLGKEDATEHITRQHGREAQSDCRPKNMFSANKLRM